ncbi:hypothetical protein [Streptomyces sp. CBMA29]|uniref:hypothetical protein n=1 Tax=Streptomyces sp. CBMA29 TaxID=1896314 RepID=UPI001661BB21|nr:hypothetical protein [Streptomyces sp. CBMA29]
MRHAADGPPAPEGVRPRARERARGREAEPPARHARRLLDDGAVRRAGRFGAALVPKVPGQRAVSPPIRVASSALGQRNTARTGRRSASGTSAGQRSTRTRRTSAASRLPAGVFPRKVAPAGAVDTQATPSAPAARRARSGHSPRRGDSSASAVASLITAQRTTALVPRRICLDGHQRGASSAGQFAVAGRRAASGVVPACAITPFTDVTGARHVDGVRRRGRVP